MNESTFRHTLLAIALSQFVLIGACDRQDQLSVEDRIQRAKDYETKGEFKAAIIELKNTVQQYPNNAQARWALGELYLQTGAGAEAEKELNKARALGVSEAALKVPLGRALLLKRDYKTVLERIQVDPSDSAINKARILQMRGDALLGLDRVDEGCGLYRQAIATQPQVTAFVGLARCALIARNPNEARNLIHKAQQLDAKAVAAWILLGDLETALGRTKQAQAAYSTALKYDPANVEALYSRAKAALYAQDLASARKDADALRKLYPSSLHWRYLDAYLLLRTGKAKEAQTRILEVLKGNPDFLPGLILAGAISQALGANEDAVTHLDKALRKDPDNRLVRRMLATVQSKLGKQDEALKSLAPLMREVPDDPMLLTLAGNILLAKGEHAKAGQYFQQALALGGANTPARTGLATALLGQGRIDQGLAELAVLAQSKEASEELDMMLLGTYLRNQRYDDLLKALDEIEQHHPATAATLNFRGAAYLGKKDYTRARGYFEQALAKDPTHMSSVMNLVQLDLRDNRPEAARKRLLAVLEAAPNNARAMLELAHLSPDPKQRLDWLLRAAKAAPKELEPMQRLAEHYLGTGEVDKALTQARQMLALRPDHPQALMLLGSAQLAGRDVASAESTFGRLTTIAPELADAHVKLAATQFALGKLRPAEDSLKRALKIMPDLVDAHTGLILVHMKQNRHDQALAVARQMQKLWPRDNLGWNLEGDIWMAQRRAPQAASAYRRAFELQPGSSTLISLHRASRLAGDVKNSDGLIETWLREHPDDLAVRQYLAHTLVEEGRDREAIAQLEQVLRLAPGQATVLNNLAVLYSRTGDARALATAEQAHRLRQTDPAIQDTLGWILAKQGKLERALPLLKQAAAATPANPETHYHLAWALAQAGERTAARKALQDLLARHREFPQRKEAEALLGRL